MKYKSIIFLFCIIVSTLSIGHDSLATPRFFGKKRIKLKKRAPRSNAKPQIPKLPLPKKGKNVGPNNTPNFKRKTPNNVDEIRTKSKSKIKKTKTQEELDFSGTDSAFGSRRQHVNAHGKNSFNKKRGNTFGKSKNYHGVFYGDPIEVTKRAWANKHATKVITNGNRDIYHIDCPNAGYIGGIKGQRQKVDCLTIIMQKNSNQVITAYPSFGYCFSPRSSADFIQN